jgi:hypothetical protein
LGYSPSTFAPEHPAAMAQIIAAMRAFLVTAALAFVISVQKFGFLMSCT